MGLSRLFQYHNEKGGLVADFGLRSIFNLLHSLVPVIPRPGVGRNNLSNRGLELVCDDGSYYSLVLDQFKVD